MGFMTEVSILNDRWDEIRNSPVEFVEQIYEASIRGTGDYGRYVIGQTTVAPSHHADTLCVYFAARNSFFEAYPKRGMTESQLTAHLEHLKEMKRYIKLAEDVTKEAIAKGDKV